MAIGALAWPLSLRLSDSSGPGQPGSEAGIETSGVQYHFFIHGWSCRQDVRHARVKPSGKNALCESALSDQDRIRHLQQVSAYSMSPTLTSARLPRNPAISSLAAGLSAAHHAYGSSKCSPAHAQCVLFIVQDPERNIFDQKHLEYQLQERHIPVFRLALSRVLDQTTVVDQASRPLLYRPPHMPERPHEVTVIYYRAGYAPNEYTSDKTWEARLHLERSAAIKCPSALTHLAGSKKVQQVLADPSSAHLQRFLPHDPGMVERIRATFARMYPLDASSAGAEARRLALDPASATRHVLKPQREGGGNNIYRANIPPFLRSIPEAHWKGYILMELIEPPELRNSILRNGRLESGPVIGEFGVFGVCLWRPKDGDGDNGDDEGGEKSGEKRIEPEVGKGGGNSRIEILENFEAGYVLRTKGRHSEEGGIAAGFGCVDSCFLVDV